MIQGQGWNSFGNAFDDMGGLTLNLLNLGLFTDGKVNVGLFELNLSRDGAKGQFGTGGVDVSMMALGFAKAGIDYVKSKSSWAENTLIAELMYEDIYIKEPSPIDEPLFEDWDIDKMQYIGNEFIADGDMSIEDWFLNTGNTNDGWNEWLRDPEALNAWYERFETERLERERQERLTLEEFARRDARIQSGDMDGLPAIGPCMLRAQLGIAESYAGRNLTEQDITDLIAEFRASGILPPANAENNFRVIDSGANVIIAGLDRLGVDVNSITVNVFRPGDIGYDNASNTALYSLLNTGTIFNSDSTAHWIQGDSSGNFWWDPNGGAIDIHERNIHFQNTRWITITLK
jgi:hypothetical protein